MQFKRLTFRKNIDIDYQKKPLVQFLASFYLDKYGTILKMALLLQAFVIGINDSYRFRDKLQYSASRHSRTVGFSC
jgi:hypothetical protein